MIRIIGKKTLYNLDNECSLREWAVLPVKKLKTHDVVNLSSGVKVKDSPNVRGKNFDGAIGYIQSNSNCVDVNVLGVALYSTPSSQANGFGINNDNFDRVVCLFSARKLIMPNWINSKDEYLAPDESNPNYEEFVNDSVVFSLFHIHANQSSLRNIFYKNNERKS